MPRIKDLLLEARGTNTVEAARKALGVTRKTYESWENGWVPPKVDPSTVTALATYLNLSPRKVVAILLAERGFENDLVEALGPYLRHKSQLTPKVA